MVDLIHQYHHLCGTPLMLCWVKASPLLHPHLFILIIRGILFFSICSIITAPTTFCTFCWPSTICYSIHTLSWVWKKNSGLESLDRDHFIRSWQLSPGLFCHLSSRFIIFNHDHLFTRTFRLVILSVVLQSCLVSWPPRLSEQQASNDELVHVGFATTISWASSRGMPWSFEGGKLEELPTPRVLALYFLLSGKDRHVYSSLARISRRVYKIFCTTHNISLARTIILTSNCVVMFIIIVRARFVVQN